MVQWSWKLRSAWKSKLVAGGTIYGIGLGAKGHQVWLEESYTMLTPIMTGFAGNCVIVLIFDRSCKSPESNRIFHIDVGSEMAVGAYHCSRFCGLVRTRRGQITYEVQPVMAGIA